jgi:hypothetical protein
MTDDDLILITARICHEVIREIQLAFSDPAPSPQWRDAEDWQRDSSLSGAAAGLAGTAPREMFAIWKESKQAAGWVWGTVKDAHAHPPTHPCLVDSWEDLPPDQRLKDAVFTAVAPVVREMLE